MGYTHQWCGHPKNHDRQHRRQIRKGRVITVTGFVVGHHRADIDRLLASKDVASCYLIWPHSFEAAEGNFYCHLRFIHDSEALEAQQKLDNVMFKGSMLRAAQAQDRDSDTVPSQSQFNLSPIAAPFKPGTSIPPPIRPTSTDIAVREALWKADRAIQDALFHLNNAQRSDPLIRDLYLLEIILCSRMRNALLVNDIIFTDMCSHNKIKMLRYIKVAQAKLLGAEGKHQEPTYDQNDENEAFEDLLSGLLQDCSGHSECMLRGTEFRFSATATSFKPETSVLPPSPVTEPLDLPASTIEQQPILDPPEEQILAVQLSSTPPTRVRRFSI
ncbi:hypothetical protein G7054_g14373 [Neopestalotiopsis clavispora]|nr:hypothetical protein G7054_g14373 [Neopestalotiopsis clavispora]